MTRWKFDATPGHVGDEASESRRKLILETDARELFERYSGKKPVTSDSHNIVLSREALYLVGLVTAQWGALVGHVEFQINYLRGHQSVPAEVRAKRLRHEAVQLLGDLREVASIVYKDARPTACSEFESILGRIANQKSKRDALVHGTYPLNLNSDPDVVGVHYKGRDHSFTLEQLTQLADEIGRSMTSLMSFHAWAFFDQRAAAMLQYLEKRDGPPSDGSENR